MKTLNTMSLVLSSNQYHAGLTEIYSHFQGFQTDEYLNDLVQDVDNANQSLVGAMHIASIRRSVQQEARLLTERIVATTRYVDSCCYVSDDEVKASAMALKQLFRYDKPFARMKVDARLGASSTLLRDLSQPEAQAHLAKLPEMGDRIEGIRQAWETLKAKRLEVDQANSAAPKATPLMTLKREAAAKLEKLVDYLKAMSLKVPDTYGEHYAVVTEIITRLNATSRRANHLQFNVELEDGEETAEGQQPAVSA